MKLFEITKKPYSMRSPTTGNDIQFDDADLRRAYPDPRENDYEATVTPIEALSKHKWFNQVTNDVSEEDVGQGMKKLTIDLATSDDEAQAIVPKIVDVVNNYADVVDTNLSPDDQGGLQLYITYK